MATVSQQAFLTSPQKSVPSTTLSTKTLFNHFFLIHDFLFRMVKSPSASSQFFDLQMSVNQNMRAAASIGGKFGQASMFTGLLVYCLKGKSIKLRFLYGFLFIYWIEHFYTLGSYIGVLLRMPSLYKQTGDYFVNNQPLDNKNLFVRLLSQTSLSQHSPSQKTQQILNRVFNQQIIVPQSYVTNDYFTKNKQKYFSEDQLVKQNNQLKLKYFDCFFTRYVYYGFQRWITKQLAGVSSKNYSS